MKFLRISPNKKMVSIGDDPKTAKWYYCEKVLDAVKVLSVGDEVSFESEQKGGSFYLTSLNKNGNVKTTPKTEATKPSLKGNDIKQINKDPAKDPSNLSVDVDLSTKVSIGQMTARSLMSMQGFINADNIDSLISRIYDKFKEKILK